MKTNKSKENTMVDEDIVLYWSDIAELTHETQVKMFGWCACEEQESFPYDDCPNQ